jgi:TonB-linked SusC/RagA family outer membrane protein
MRKCTKTTLFVLCTVCCVSLSVSSRSQEIARASYKYSYGDTHPPQRDDNQVSLKDAVSQLKKQYKIKVAYREGLLDGKTVPASLVKNMTAQDAEQALKLLINNSPLSYKKISANQFSLFEARTENNPRPVTQPAYVVPITGNISSAGDGTAVVGATVYVKSNPNIATMTDIEGNFKLVLPDELKGKTITLVITSVGYAKKEAMVGDVQNPVSIKLEKSNAELGEVVVTALGINKQKKSLGYSVTEVKGQEFTQARENNVANALSGKIAGVNAAGLSTGPGGSSRVTIRGNGTLGPDNQPLYVVNGMPIDNSVPGGAPTVNGITSNVDRGDGIAGINPDDIESISVLKGGTAAALYGSRAANGVILITTKRGRAQRGVGIEYNATVTAESIAVIPDYQYEYGQGDGGVKPTTLAASQATGRRSWGAKIDGSTDYVGVDGKTHPYVAQKKNLQHFYQTGLTYTNSLAFTGGNESFTYRFSAADLNSKGILPNTTYKRKTLNLAVNAKLSSKLSIEALAQYNLEKGHNRTGAGDALGNPNWTPLEIANTADVRWAAPGYDANGNETIWNDAAIASNGYFVINKYLEDDTKNRFIGQASISYELVKNLVVKGTVSRDFYNYNYVNILPTGALYTPLGEYAGIKSDVSETNGMVTGTYKFNVAKEIGVSVLAGVNGRRFENKQITQTGSQFTIPYFYSYANLATASTKPYTARMATNSIFGSADFDYKGLFFVTVSGREDWFSTLSPKNNHIFYPSVGGSFILSDALQLPAFFNFAKIRASWAQVGGGAPDPYAINLTYSNVPSSAASLLNVTPDPTSGNNKISNSNLQPYTSTTYEAGFELQTMANRLGLDVTFYNRKTTNEIVNTAISTTSGYNDVILNVGELRNTGIEVLLTGKPVKGSDFGWNVSYNVAYNDNKIIKLAPGLTSIQVASSVGNWAYLNHIEGKPFGTLVGTRIQRDANGVVVFNATTGLPVQTGLQQLGNSVAPLTMGITNEFRYKDLSFSFLLDGKFGNKIFSIFEVYAVRMGKLKSTLPGRENGLELVGVDQSGSKYTRTVPVSGLRPYYDNYKTYSELFLHDGSFVKLRQVILSYNLPVSKLKIIRLQSASISFVARNLLTLYKQTDNFDPEQSFTNSNNQGFESIGLPRTRSYGLNLAVKL